MDKLKFYQIAAALLLLLNFSMIAFHLFVRPQHGPKKSNPAIEVLKMDQEQLMGFQELVTQHRLQMKTIHVQQQELLKPYFTSLVDSSNIDRDALLFQVLQLERQKIKATYQHFKDAKPLLKPEQHANYEQFIEIVLKKILQEKNNKPHRPKDSE